MAWLIRALSSIKMGKHPLDSHLKSLPEEPGVYKFYDNKGIIIYIGKAKNLKKRVSSYFGKSRYDSFKVKVLVERIADLNWIVVGSESDALLLENNLIKKHQPRYNILLKDDKTFPWICIKNEPFPRVFATRTILNDGSRYFGPYTSAFAVKVLLDLIRQIYQLRNCKLALTDENIAQGKYKVCLEYHIGNCQAPCVGKQDMESYDESIEQIKAIISGNLSEVIGYLRGQMKKYAEAYRYEDANRFKEKIEILSRYQAKSTIVNPVIHNVDVFSIVSDENEAFVNFLKVVKGAVVQAHTILVKKKLDEEDAELLSFVIADLRSRIESSAKEIIVPFDVSHLFPENRITVPRRGDKKKLLDLSERNAKSFRMEKKRHQSALKGQGSSQRILATLREDLRLSQLPIHIECFDNSNIQGSDPVAACVVFKNARPAKKEYRHYHIKGVTGANDFASMEEVVYRRYKRMQDEQSSIPQLIVIDGGKGQLSAALKSLDRLNLRGKIAIIGIAKKLEEIFFPDDPVPLYIDKNSESLKLIQNLRNEAHRFGINFHRQLRSGAMLKSAMLEIPGVGLKSIEKMYSKFKSMEGIGSASEEELAAEIGLARARLIRDYFLKMG